MKLIVHNRTDRPMLEILPYIKTVLRQDRISNSRKQYCYVSTFADGTVVTAELNQKSDKLIVSKL